MGDQDLSPSEDRESCGDWQPPKELQQRLRFQPPSPEVQDKQLLLASIIENDVIPRLLLANGHELAIAPPVSDRTAAKLADCVGEFSEIVIGDDAAQSTAYFEALYKQGISVEQLFQDLLAPAARRLGELWVEDINDFLDVTRGIGHLQQIVRAYSSAFHDEISQPLSSRRALLMPLPGDQHTFGVSLLREHFLRDGWRVWCGPCESMADIVKLVKHQWLEMVGLSASSVFCPEKLAADIRDIRKASLNKKLQVFVGGYAFNTKPDLVGEVGADATAIDGRHALLAISRAITVA